MPILPSSFRTGLREVVLTGIAQTTKHVGFRRGGIGTDSVRFICCASTLLHLVTVIPARWPLPGHYYRPLGRRINVYVSTSIREAFQAEWVAAEVTKVDKTDVLIAWALIIHNPWVDGGRMQQR